MVMTFILNKEGLSSDLTYTSIDTSIVQYSYQLTKHVSRITHKKYAIIEIMCLLCSKTLYHISFNTNDKMKVDTRIKLL